ncbi:hypothetical protein ABW19_dt0207340 [Dactylella cylindrospora]|nr:hypothetical protein ABW19_dt0207340 [Dactylella cylindrospora]
MASYYYHVVLELHDRSEPISERAIADKLVPDILDYTLPQPGADIFNLVGRSKTASSTQDATREESAKKSDSREDCSLDYLDYRFSLITLESINMSLPHQLPSAIDTPSLRARGKSVSFGEGTDSHSLATKARYAPIVSSPPANIGYGVVHLYRDKAETPGLFKAAPQGAADIQNNDNDDGDAKDKGLTALHDNGKDVECNYESTILAILAVPAYMTPSDFLGFVGDDARESVSHFRLIRTGDDVRKYMALMKFRDLEDAKCFAREFNGRVFNTMEPETCHVVFVKSVQIQVGENETAKPISASTSSSYMAAEESLLPGNEPSPSYQQNPTPMSATHLTTKPAPPPTASLLELPTCPVCLERMDETTGLLTTQCQHVFHCACLSKWKDGSCPVCRYTSSDRPRVPGTRRRRGKLKSLGLENGDESDEELDVCVVCGAVDNLWICLICGHVGCGRYDEKHAYEHYERTQHYFAMDIETQRVWDYASDQYVHRLVQNKSDGKLVELPSGRPDENTEELYDKLDNIGMEYTYLLASQLDSQRSYFEEQVLAAADKAMKASRRADESSEKLEMALLELESIRAKLEEFSTDVVPSLEKGKARAEKKLEKATDLLRKFEKDWKEEKTVNQGLLERVEKLSKESEDMKRENVELKEQIREKLKEMNEEGIEEGEVSVADAPDGKKKKKGKGKGKR